MSKLSTIFTVLSITVLLTACQNYTSPASQNSLRMQTDQDEISSPSKVEAGITILESVTKQPSQPVQTESLVIDRILPPTNETLDSSIISEEEIIERSQGSSEEE